MGNDSPDYDVALSFAGEDREYVAQVVAHLQEAGIQVFYDEYEAVTLWGKNLYTHLQDVYHNKAKYTVMFISQHYVSKLWPNHERESAQARALEENQEYILPARFDDTVVPGLLPTTGYVDLRSISPSELAELVTQKLNPHFRAAKTQINRDSVLELVSKVQNKNIPLSESLSQALILAHEIGDRNLIEFCTNELIGYHKDLSQEECEHLGYRGLEAYCSPGIVNPQHWGWGGETSNIFTYMESHPDEFVNKTLVIQAAITEIEHYAQDSSSEKYIMQTLPVSIINPEADSGEMKIRCYSRGDGYQKILENIRSLLSKKLLDLIN